MPRWDRRVDGRGQDGGARPEEQRRSQELQLADWSCVAIPPTGAVPPRRSRGKRSVTQNDSSERPQQSKKTDGSVQPRFQRSVGEDVALSPSGFLENPSPTMSLCRRRCEARRSAGIAVKSDPLPLAPSSHQGSSGRFDDGDGTRNASLFGPAPGSPVGSH